MGNASVVGRYILVLHTTIRDSDVEELEKGVAMGPSQHLTVSQCLTLQPNESPSSLTI